MMMMMTILAQFYISSTRTARYVIFVRLFVKFREKNKWKNCIHLINNAFTLKMISMISIKCFHLKTRTVHCIALYIKSIKRLILTVSFSLENTQIYTVVKSVKRLILTVPCFVVVIKPLCFHVNEISTNTKAKQTKMHFDFVVQWVSTLPNGLLMDFIAFTSHFFHKTKSWLFARFQLKSWKCLEWLWL